MSEISPEALAEVDAALIRYGEAFEQAVQSGVYKHSTWKDDYRRGAQYFVDWLNGTFNPSEGRPGRRTPRMG